ncbi:MAG: type II toxin-antitoxin system Phd/YefM family antitoxin [Phycisphaerales bacterium]|nr:type II toxin-antitoxin system Phd/YefM family antitoxin [Phycisphaerales bacterium]
MDKAIDVSIIRTELATTVNRVAFGGERLLVKRSGKPVLAMVPVADLELLEALEDVADVKAARNALDGMKRKGEKPDVLGTGQGGA